MVHTFLKGICPKVNVIAQLEYELAYNDYEVHRFNHFTTRTPPSKIYLSINLSMLTSPTLQIYVYIRAYICVYGCVCPNVHLSIYLSPVEEAKQCQKVPLSQCTQRPDNSAME